MINSVPHMNTDLNIWRDFTPLSVMFPQLIICRSWSESFRYERFSRASSFKYKQRWNFTPVIYLHPSEKSFNI